MLELFEDIIGEIRLRVDGAMTSGCKYTASTGIDRPWPEDRNKNLVMKNETAMEIGTPSDGAVSFTVWTGNPLLVRDGAFTLVGPDVGDCDGYSLPLARVVILAVDGFTEENCCDRHLEIELMRHELNLKGYMMRATSRYAKEWIRIGKQARADGFSFEVLSSALMRIYRKLDFVVAVESLFVTSSSEDVGEIERIGARAARRMDAMNRMRHDFSCDCLTCDYNDVCAEVSQLREMRDALRSGGEKVFHDAE